RDQQQRLLAAVGVAGVQRVVADVADGRILARAGPRDRVHRRVQLLRDAPGVGFVAHDLARERVQVVCEQRVRGALGDARGQLRRDFRRDDAFGVYFEVAGADVELVAGLEGRLLAGDRRLLEVDGALEGGGRRELVRGGSA